MATITVERETLLDLLQSAQGIVEKRSINPILTAVIVASSEGELSVQGTNMEESIRVRAKGGFEGDIYVAVSLSRLVDFVRELSPGPVGIEFSEEGHLLTVSQKKAQAHIPVLSVEDFPVLPPPPDVTFPIERGVLVEALSKVFFSIAVDAMSTALKGLFVKKTEDGIAFVSTDGHRLSLLEMEYTDLPYGEMGLVVPRKGVQEIRRLVEKSKGDTALLGVVQNHLYVSTEKGEIFVRLLDARYPNYQKVIPKEFSTKVILNREALAKAVKRASLFSSERSMGVKAEIGSDGIRVSSMVTAEEVFEGSAVEEVEVLEFSGEPIKIGLNAKYVQEVLSVLDGQQVCMEMGTRLWPVKFTSEDSPGYLHLVMPIQLEEASE